MSDVTMFLRGQLDPQQFITKAATDLQKDLAFFGNSPFAKALENFALSALSAYLSTKLSPVLTNLIIGEIKKILGLDTSPGPVVTTQ